MDEGDDRPVRAGDPLQGQIVVFGSTPILSGLARDWATRDELGALTVVGLQEAIHALELARVHQPVQVRFTFNFGNRPTRPDNPVLEEHEDEPAAGAGR